MGGAGCVPTIRVALVWIVGKIEICSTNKYLKNTK